MDKQAVISAWVRSGVRDFYLFFELDGAWWSYNAFFLHQGLEKLCKAYILGERAATYENLPETEARRVISKIVRGKDLSHSLARMVAGLADRKVLNLPQSRVDGKTWIEILTILEDAYDQCRYPLPLQPAHRRYPLKDHKGVYNGVLESSYLRDVAYPLARQILERIGTDFSVQHSLKKDACNPQIDDKQWQRFGRLFFKKS